ncbi:MAG: dCMP deaminase family protein [Candidatus Gracilibacteria bacterium]
MDTRPSKDEYYLDLAKSVCRRSTCTKVEIGAVIIREDQVVATGYCGAPRGTKSSLEHGFCLRKKLGIPSGHRYEMCRSVHAEQNAIINAARSGTSLLGGDMYIYGKVYGNDQTQPIDAFPCFICKKMLINCGLKRVICSLKDGTYKIFQVADWLEEWGKNDIIDDEFQYGEKTEGKQGTGLPMIQGVKFQHDIYVSMRTLNLSLNFSLIAAILAHTAFPSLFPLYGIKFFSINSLCISTLLTPSESLVKIILVPSSFSSSIILRIATLNLSLAQSCSFRINKTSGLSFSNGTISPPSDRSPFVLPFLEIIVPLPHSLLSLAIFPSLLLGRLSGSRSLNNLVTRPLTA